MSTTQLFPAFDAPLADICYNLAQARTVTAQYLEITARNAAPMGELIRVVTSMHVYMDTHIDVLWDFKFADSQYRLALRSQIHVIASRIPADLRHPLWKKWYLTSEEALRHEYALDNEALLPGEEGYTHNREGCVAKADALPYRVVELPPPRRPTATPSPVKSPLMPTPAAVAVVKPLKELAVHIAFSAPGKKLAGDLLPSSGPSSGGPTTRKHRRDQQTASNLPVPTSSLHTNPLVHQSRATSHAAPSKSKPRKAIRKSPAPQAAKLARTAKKPVFDSSSDSNVLESLTYPGSPTLPKEPLFFPSNNNAASNGVASHVLKRVRAEPPVSEAPALFVMHAYHLLTGEPLPGLIALPSSASVAPVQVKGKGREVIPLSPIPTLPVLFPPSCIQKGPVSASKAIASGSQDTGVAIPSSTVDRTVYACTFDPQVSLQYHEPTSHYALERMQLSALPAALASLLKPTTQGRCTAVYGVHSDVGVHILRIPHQYWPCFNCTISGHAHLCKFPDNATPGKEACLHCQTARHGHCSARMNADDFRKAATLLDPLVQSGDPAISEGLQRADRLENDIDMLYTILLNRIEERDNVIKGLADGLDAIAACEGGTAIIDQYAEAHELIQSLIIDVGKYGGASGV
ncbi:hypothetical protein IW261DRAFT_1572912 [Armillaria novae-zelandiae]|uniref:Uncharacterized protein n=1 Tax=Armillaria novae-zelandiae TaxID=153914 RepID=A0AA39NRT0_9AGAR|nr:hypothetical protein IW261DRAFT_1572912 [Armillaria novae-zelandiae]